MCDHIFTCSSEKDITSKKYNFIKLWVNVLRNVVATVSIEGGR